MPVLLHRVRRHLLCRTAVGDSEVAEDQEEVEVEVQEAMVVGEVLVMAELAVEPVLEVEIQREPAVEVRLVREDPVVVVDHQAVVVPVDLEASVAKEETTDAAEQRVARNSHPCRAASAKVKVAMELEMVVVSQWLQWERRFPEECRRHRNCGARNTAQSTLGPKQHSD